MKIEQKRGIKNANKFNFNPPIPELYKIIATKQYTPEMILTFSIFSIKFLN